MDRVNLKCDCKEVKVFILRLNFIIKVVYVMLENFKNYKFMGFKNWWWGRYVIDLC